MRYVGAHAEQLPRVGARWYAIALVGPAVLALVAAGVKAGDEVMGRTDRHAGVPHRQQYTVGGGARRRTAQRRQLDGVHDGVPAIHRFRERAELVDGPM